MTSQPTVMPAPRTRGEQLQGPALGLPAETPVSSRADPQATVAGVLVRWVQSRPVVLLVGDVDLQSAPQIASVGLFLRRWPHRAVVDAAEVSFIDVAGLRAVLALGDPGGAVEVRYPSWSVLRLLRVLMETGTGISISRAPGPHPALMVRTTP